MDKNKIYFFYPNFKKDDKLCCWSFSRFYSKKSISLFFFWLRGMWDLISPTRDRPWLSSPALETQSLNHWTAREVPKRISLEWYSIRLQNSSRFIQRFAQKIKLYAKMLPNQLGRWIQKSHSYIGNVLRIYKWDSHRLVRVGGEWDAEKLGITLSVSYKFLIDGLQRITRRQAFLHFRVKFFLGPSKTLGKLDCL